MDSQASLARSPPQYTKDLVSTAINEYNALLKLIASKTRAIDKLQHHTPKSIQHNIDLNIPQAFRDSRPTETAEFQRRFASAIEASQTSMRELIRETTKAELDVLLETRRTFRTKYAGELHDYFNEVFMRSCQQVGADTTFEFGPVLPDKAPRVLHATIGDLTLSLAFLNDSLDRIDYEDNLATILRERRQAQRQAQRASAEAMELETSNEVLVATLVKQEVAKKTSLLTKEINQLRAALNASANRIGARDGAKPKKVLQAAKTTKTTKTSSQQPSRNEQRKAARREKRENKVPAEVRQLREEFQFHPNRPTFKNALAIFALRDVKEVDSEISNLTFHDLTPPLTHLPATLKRLLGLNLNFCPTPRHLSTTDLQERLPDFVRSLRLRYLFRNKNDANFTKTSVYVKNEDFQPPPCPPAIEATLKKIEQRLHATTLVSRRRFNMTKTQRDLLKTLMFRHDLKVLLTDKNLGPAIMTSTQYVDFCLDHLQDTTTYRNIQAPPEVILKNDGLIIWRPRTEDPFALQRFFAKFTRLSRLKFTHELSGTEAPFLDLWIIKIENGLRTKTHQKALNLYLYLPAASAHPPGVLKGLIYGLVKKYAMQNPDPTDFKLIVNLLLQRLQSRGYRVAQLLPIFRAALEATKAPRQRTTKIFFKVPFDPNGPSSADLKKLLDVEAIETEIKKFGIDQVSLCYLKPPTLKRKLCPTRLPPTFSPTPANRLALRTR